MIGRSLAHYRITAAIGAGGMGEVYRATDTRLGREVAVKVLPHEVARDPDRLARFQREARAVASLNHPHIVTLHSVEEAEGVHFLTMELVEGQPLDRLITGGGLPVDRVLAIGAALGDALAAAHDKGIVHRDLKPANVMVTAGGWVKVLDFGLAKEVVSGAPQDATITTGGRTELGVALGTPAYMSPEQVTGRGVDHRTDIFSLGILLYEMASGRRPFEGASAAELTSAILRDTPPPLDRIRAGAGAGLTTLVARCLEKDPGRRVQTAREVAEACRSLARGDSSSGASARFSLAPSRASGSSGETQRPGIVVLPFANLSSDAENEYFSDGLTEELIADLSKVAALRVISRTSSMQLKGAKKDVRTIGQELGVRYVLEGGVRKSGNSLRITAQFIDALTDAHLWSDKYSGTLDDVFEVQERVSREIVRALNVTLTTDERRRLAERPIANVRAFELYLQARQELRRMGVEALERASSLLSEAMAIEGETAPLLALKAWVKVTQVRLGYLGGEAPLDEAEARARALLDLDPDSVDAHALLGFVAYERGDMRRGVEHLKRALEQESNNADALFFLGVSYVAAGQTEEALAVARRIVASDPLATLSWMLSGVALWFVGRFDEALPELQRGLELDPRSYLLQWCAAYNCAALGRLSEAARHAAVLHEMGPDVPYTRQLLALLDGLEGRTQSAREKLASLETSDLDAHNKFHLGESFGLAGDVDRALDLIDQGVDGGFYPYPFLAEHCPFLAPLRKSARFTQILDKARARSVAFRT